MTKAVLFDLDGVLVDSYETTITYFQESLSHFGYPKPAKEAFLPLMGYRSLDMIKKLLPDISEEKLTEIFSYSQELSLQYASKIPLFPNAKEALEHIAGRYKTGLITSRGKETTKVILNHHAMTKYFLLVIDRDDIINHKPHPEGLLKAMTFLNVTSDEAVYIGDTAVDAEAAKAAGIPSIIFSQTKPSFGDYRISDLAELPEFIDEIDW
jgi:phosphoglycolate phosphatase